MYHPVEMHEPCFDLYLANKLKNYELEKRGNLLVFTNNHCSALKYYNVSLKNSYLLKHFWIKWHRC